MPRRNRPPEREVQPDIRYNSVTVACLINKVMKQGKKSLAMRIVYDAMSVIGERTNRDSLEVVEQAVENAKPVLTVRPRRVGGATYQVPMEVPSSRRLSLALRWLTEAARGRPERLMSQKLATELMDAARGEGGAVRRKEDVHRMAEANKAFAHFRW
ncbi:MAG: 30S ribosomal protein S7 [Chloroflexota bacterium]|nr:30S ribosomal protein S7 [Chloroflexota bacterium]